MKENSIFVQRLRFIILSILALTVCCHRHPETDQILIVHMCEASCWVWVWESNVKEKELGIFKCERINMGHTTKVSLKESNAGL